MMPGYWPGASGQATKLGIWPYLVVTMTSFSYMGSVLRSGLSGWGIARADSRVRAGLSRGFGGLLPAVKDRLALFAPGFERLRMVFGIGAAGAHGLQRLAVEPAGGGLVDGAFQA